MVEAEPSLHPFLKNLAREADRQVSNETGKELFFIQFVTDGILQSSASIRSGLLHKLTCLATTARFHAEHPDGIVAAPLRDVPHSPFSKALFEARPRTGSLPIDEVPEL